MAQPVTWTHPEHSLTLGAHTVHIWRSSLNSTPRHRQYYLTILSTEEQQRAAQYYHNEAAERFVSSRGILRCLLGRYLHVAPNRIALQNSPHGKPQLSRHIHPPNLHFNVTHSQSLALYAFSLGRPVGIDLEASRTIHDPLQLAMHYCTPYEQQQLHTLPAAQRQAAFLACWTRKEAYVKALGLGLRCPFHQIEVSIYPQALERLRAFRGDPTAAEKWTLHSFTPAPDYYASLVVEGHDWSPYYFQYRGTSSHA